jgi:hypothetical protein
MGGNIKRIRYLKYSVPDDIAADVNLSDNLEDEAEMEMIIKAKREQFLDIPDWLSDIVSGRTARSDFIEMSGVEYDNVKVEIDLNGKRKTLNLSDVRKLRMNIDVTDEVSFGNDGHPVFESIRELSNNLLVDLADSLGWEND